MAAQKGFSDMEYLKSKMVAAELSSEEESEDEAVNCDEGSEAEESSTTKTQQGTTVAFSLCSQTEKPANKKEPTTSHTVKLWRALFSVTEGRMLHVLPSTISKEASEDADTPGSSYKKKAASKDKASSSSSHNWNMLFMGPNAVAKAITQKYIATKSQETKGSMAVCVAPGETQLVQEVQCFLLHNGVSLDSFSQATAERSKTVIMAKNLLSGTLEAELWETFGCFGRLGRVLLPKGSVTAIIMEFLEPLEACRAF
ncbi:putative RNA-binding protein 19 [Sciurus carolinensis]|uniref:RNA-binding protein 19 n=1 Tax=Sciurus carolinensis TaxID=30640 RepID=A0AA41SV82_SCICA|nr:putative RNA-binding protein 19 [Sciurus carolinensis]